MIRLLQYTFDEFSKDLERLAEAIHLEYCITGYSEGNSSGSEFYPTHHVSSFLWMRSHSPSVRKGYILGVEESYLVVKECAEQLKLVTINALPDKSIDLWVNADGVIRVYIFINIPLIIENKLRKLQMDGNDP